MRFLSVIPLCAAQTGITVVSNTDVSNTVAVPSDMAKILDLAKGVLSGDVKVTARHIDYLEGLVGKATGATPALTVDGQKAPEGERLVNMADSLLGAISDRVPEAGVVTDDLSDQLKDLTPDRVGELVESVGDLASIVIAKTAETDPVAARQAAELLNGLFALVQDRQPVGGSATVEEVFDDEQTVL